VNQWLTVSLNATDVNYSDVLVPDKFMKTPLYSFSITVIFTRLQFELVLL